MQESTFQKADEESNPISREKEMRARALSREFFLRDQMQYQDDARGEGWKEGWEEGLELGKVQSVIRTVKLLVKKGWSPSKVSDYLEMPLSEVEDYLSK